MNNQHQFYVTLPSNSAQHADPSAGENTASDFRVKLQQRIRLDGDWEVGLAEIIYPNTWMNLSSINEQNIIKLFHVPTRTKVSMAIKPGRYLSIYDLVSIINSAVLAKSNEMKENETLRYVAKEVETILVEVPHQELKTGIKFEYDRETRRVSVHLDPEIVKHVDMSEQMQYMLGLTKEQMKAISNVEKAKEVRAMSKVPDLRAGFECLYVYCDLCTSQPVGDVLAPLLRIVNVQGVYSEVVARIYDTPHYVPVLHKDISSITINIKNDLNQFVDFEYGKVVVKLHFRRCSPMSLF